MELHMEPHTELHMELHVELHMSLHMELHMGSIWRPIWADKRSPSMLISLHQNKIETAIYIYIYMRMNPEHNASRFSGEPETLNATHKTD